MKLVMIGDLILTELWVGRALFRFVRERIDGAVPLVCTVPSGSEQEARDLAKQNPHLYRLIEDAAVVPVEAPRESERPDSWLIGLLFYIPMGVLQAIKNGWRWDDITGAGMGGGVGVRSGLTLDQLTETSPPPNWEDAAEADLWPWEVEGWEPPQGFVAPGGSKAPEPQPDESSAATGAPAPALAAAIAEQPETPPAPPAVNDSVSSAPDAGDARPDPAPKSDDATPASILKTKKEIGWNPTLASANYALEKAGFPKLTSMDEVNAMLNS